MILAVSTVACDSGNPVAPSMPVVDTPTPTFEILLSADPPRLTAGSSTGSAIGVRVRRNDNGQPPADGTEITLDTSLGNFGVTAQGDPIQLVRLSLQGGEARTTLLAAAEDVGTAVVLAQLSDSSAQLTVAIGDPGDLPSADFELAIDRLTVTFADRSTGDPTSWRWEFGDGNSSTQQNPTHEFAEAGTYAVKLTVSNGAGSNAKTQLVTVPSDGPPSADFSFQPEGLKVFFLDASAGNPESWAWNFGDGNSSTLQNPSHTYAAAGTYTVSLTATNVAGSDTTSQLVSVTLGDPPTADFSFVVDGLSVTFLDASTGNPNEWMWNFGDGRTSTMQDPSHLYIDPGTYTVRLTATNAAGSDSAVQTVTVSPVAAPVADFSFVIDKRKVIFTDRSTGGPTGWSWDFGDNRSSMEQSPDHCYENDGTYTVRLTVTNSGGNSSSSQFITVSDPENTTCPGT